MPILNMDKVLLTKEFGNNIAIRSSMSAFFEKLDKSKKSKIKLDFKNVVFISRSCVDEYIKQKKATKKEIIEVNMSRNILRMFETVRNQYEENGAPFLFKIYPKNGRSLIVINN